MNDKSRSLQTQSLRLIAVALSACLFLTGCNTIQVRSRSIAVNHSSAAELGDVHISKRTQLTLRTYGLEKTAKKNFYNAFHKLEDEINREPTLDLVFAAAELANLEAKKQSNGYTIAEPMKFYYDSVKYAFGYLFDPRFKKQRNRYDPHFRVACRLYNEAVEHLLRSESKKKSVQLLPDDKIDVLGMKGRHIATLRVVHRTNQWNPDDLEPFKFAADYEVQGLENQYRQYGLGVPLLGQKKSDAKKSLETKYTSDNLCFPATAVLRFLPPSAVSAKEEAVIELYDPLNDSGADIMEHIVPLESDLTTPLAYSISGNKLASAAGTVGLLRPDMLLKPFKNTENSEDSRRTVRGLYMMQSFEHGKIPVVFVHGIWSSPLKWIEMFNMLQSESELRKRYQFYFYFYPTGQPFWVSAAQLRDDLAEFRQTFDPQHRDNVFNRMILIGHSMGGLLAHLQAISSGQEFWKRVSDLPPETVLEGLAPELRQEVEKWFFFRANPSVQRVITIGTPFNGSKTSNDFLQWMSRTFITLPENVKKATAALIGKDELLQKDSLLKIETVAPSLRYNLPVFAAMKQQRQRSAAVFNNIIGETEPNVLMKQFTEPTDGVVNVSSAMLERYESEIKVICPHSDLPSHPKTILEVRRILSENLKR